MTNLLKETLVILENNDKSFDDVLFIGIKDGSKLISKEKFISIAEKLDYNAGHGHAEINEELVIVGEDWWLERGEYDGAEWWEFKQLPVKKHDAGELEHIYDSWHYKFYVCKKAETQ